MISWLAFIHKAVIHCQLVWEHLCWAGFQFLSVESLDLNTQTYCKCVNRDKENNNKRTDMVMNFEQLAFWTAIECGEEWCWSRNPMWAIKS